MHSDFLNQDKICEMFQQDHDSAQKKQQISLNFTVTSRQSKSVIPMVGTYQSKTHCQFDNNIQSHQNNKIIMQLKPSSPQRNINSALEELDKFNNWLNTQSKQNDKLISQVSTLTSLAQSNRSVLLSMPDFSYLRKKCKSAKINSSNIGHKNFGQNYYFEGPSNCQQCKYKDQLIQIINQQYNAKQQQFNLLQQELKNLQTKQQKQMNTYIKSALLDGVELNILKQQNASLNMQISNLRLEIEKEKFQKSQLLQKSTSLLKTKQLQKKSQAGCTTNSKLFSNAKYSTNSINPNDTMNKVDSIICFGDTEPNLEQLIKFYGQEANAFKIRCRQFGIDEKRGYKKQSINSELDAIQKISQLCKDIQSKFIDLRSYKIKNPNLFMNYMKDRRSVEQDQYTLSNRLQKQQLKKIISGLEKKIKGIENQNNNLQQTNFDLVDKVSELSNNIKIYEQNLKKRDDALRLYQDKYLKMKSEQKHLYQKYKIQLLSRKRLLYDIQDLKGNIRFYLRVRPRIGSELKHKSTIVFSKDNTVIKDNRQFQFNYVFGQRTQQMQIFEEVKGLVQYAYEGKNLCIFGYGQTGSGKSHTLFGELNSEGLAQNIINRLFQLIEFESKIYQTTIKMGILQIYKEQVRDLLGISCTDNISVRQDPQRGVYLQQHKFIQVQKRQHALELYNHGVMGLNKKQDSMIDTSKTHRIFNMRIQKVKKRHNRQQKQFIRENNEVIRSSITLVELAGSERITSSNPLHIKQSQFINKSIDSLTSVLSALKNKNQYIPYKDSKLTLLLKDSLTQTSNIVTFINVSPSQLCSIETTNSMYFAMRVKNSDKSILRPKQSKQKQGKQNEKNKRSSTRLSIG